MTREDASLTELVAQATRDMTILVRKEVELARTEVAKAGRGAGMFGGAGVVALYAVGFALLAATYGLGEVMPLGWAALIVAGACLAVSGVLALVGRRTMRSLRRGLGVPSVASRDPGGDPARPRSGR